MNVEHTMNRDVGIIRGMVIPALMYPVLLAGIALLNMVIWFHERWHKWHRR